MRLRTLLLCFLIALFSCCTREPHSPPPARNSTHDSTATEKEKIEALIQGVESAKDLVFIRNDVEYNAGDAADHMRRKWRAAGDRVKTAEEFIEHCASKSSISGKPYLIRKAGGKEVPAGEYLHERLAEIEKR